MSVPQGKSFAADWFGAGRDPARLDARGKLNAGVPIKATVQDEAERIIRFRITTGSRDRDGDVIEPAGWDVDNYILNPVVLWAHNYSHPPIARSLEIIRSRDGLDSVAQFADTETKGSYLGGRDVFGLYRGGYMSAVSVGFIPTKWERQYEDDAFTGFHFTEQELLEYSTVPVPANQEALALAVKSGALSRRGFDVVSDLLSMRGETLRPEKCPDCESRKEAESRERGKLAREKYAEILAGAATRIRSAGHAERLSALAGRLAHGAGRSSH